MKRVLMIIAPKDFKDEEYFVPKKNLESAGFIVTTASLSKGECAGVSGGIARAGLALRDVSVDDFNVFIFVGGPGAALYQNDQEAHRIARESLEKGKLLAAICIAPMILVYAGVLRDRNATVWNGDGDQARVFVELGVNFVDEDVVIDGDIITANGPAAAEKFSQIIIKKLL